MSEPTKDVGLSEDRLGVLPENVRVVLKKYYATTQQSGSIKRDEGGHYIDAPVLMDGVAAVGEVMDAFPVACAALADALIENKTLKAEVERLGKVAVAAKRVLDYIYIFGVDSSKLSRLAELCNDLNAALPAIAKATEEADHD